MRCDREEEEEGTGKKRRCRVEGRERDDILKKKVKEEDKGERRNTDKRGYGEIDDEVRYRKIRVEKVLKEGTV